MDVWQIGILLIGIGVLFFCVYLGMFFKELRESVSQVKKMLIRNEREIEDLIRNTAQITTTINDLSSGITNGMGKFGFLTKVASKAVSVAKMRKKRKA